MTAAVRRDRAWRAALAILPLLLVAPALLPGRSLSTADLLTGTYLLSGAQPPGYQPANPLLSDPAQQMIPFRRLVVDELRAGRIPFWNPYAYAGSPLLGNSQSAVFDPLALPYLLFARVDDGTVWVAFLRLFVAALGAFLFARALGLPREASALAGLAYGCGGFMVVWLLYPPASSAAWVGFVFWAGERMARRATPGNVAGLGASLALTVLGGHVETSFLAAAAVSVYVLARRWQLTSGSPRAAAASLGPLAAGGALSAALAAVHIAPFLEALAEGTAGVDRIESIRRVGPRILLDLPQYVGHLDRLVLLAFPYLYGRPVAGEITIGGAWTNFCEHSGGYGSLAGLVLAVAAVVLSRRGSPVRVIAPIALAAWLHSIWFPPALLAARFLPGLQLVFPERSVFVALFGLAVLAGFGLEELRSSEAPRARRLLLVGAALLAIAAAAAAAAAVWLVEGSPGREVVARLLLSARILRPVPDLVPKAEAFFSSGAGPYARLYLLPWAGLALALATVLAGLRLRPRWRGWPAAVLLVAGADLFLFAHGFNPAVPRALVYPRTRALERVRAAAGAGRLLVLDHGLVPNVATYFGLADLAGYDAINRRRLEELARLAGADDRKAPGQALLAFVRCESPFFDALAVRMVVAHRPLERPGLELADRDGPIHVYRNLHARPFVSVPAEVVVARSRSDAARALRVPSSDPVARTVVEAATGTVAAARVSRLSWTRPEPCRILIDADVSSAGALVVAESFDRGWSARVDGAPAAVYPADLAMMAVAVPQGRHAVELRFQPRSWWGAVAATAVGLAALLALVVTASRGSRPAPTPPSPPSRGSGRSG